MVAPAQWKTTLLKVQAMSAGELRTRAYQWAYSLYERRRVQQHPGRSLHGKIRASFSPDISGGRFFQSLTQHGELRHLLSTTFSADVATLIARADRAQQNRVTLFHTEYALGSSVDWHRDPASGWRWPAVYHGDVFATDVPTGIEVKDVWELNRQQFLIDLAIASVVTGRSDYATAAARMVRGWIEQNPAGVGVNWAGPLEVAYRALSWLWVAHLIEPHVRGDDDLLASWSGCLWQHGAFLHRHLELYSSPYNHLISQAAVLFILGVVFPSWSEAADWQKRGRQVLEERLAVQFYADGGSVEQAVVYHHATLGFYLLAALVARNNAADLSPAVWRAIERAIEWSGWLTQPDGFHPAIGDNDDARPVRFAPLPTWDFRHFQSIGAVLFERSDFRARAGQLHQDAVWLLGPDAVARFERLPSADPQPPSIVLAGSGYAVLRSGWHERADYVCFDAGEQAGGLRADAIPSAAHGHADCLSVIASLDGVPVFVDAGFYTYNSDAHWERVFRDTEAHNTLRVDGRSQARHLGKMAWAEVPRARLDGSEVQPTARVLWARGSHDGYERGADGLRHTRTALLKPGEWLAILDELSGSGDHVFDLGFTCAPERQVAPNDAGATIDDKWTLTIRAVGPLAVDVVRGEPTNAAWVAPALEVRQPAARIVASGRFTGPITTVLTVIAARSAELRIEAADFPAVVRPLIAELLDRTI